MSVAKGSSLVPTPTPTRSGMVDAASIFRTGSLMLPGQRLPLAAVKNPKPSKNSRHVVGRRPHYSSPSANDLSLKTPRYIMLVSPSAKAMSPMEKMFFGDAEATASASAADPQHQQQFTFLQYAAGVDGKHHATGRKKPVSIDESIQHAPFYAASLLLNPIVTEFDTTKSGGPDEDEEEDSSSRVVKGSDHRIPALAAFASNLTGVNPAPSVATQPTIRTSDILASSQNVSPPIRGGSELQRTGEAAASEDTAEQGYTLVNREVVKLETVRITPPRSTIGIGGADTLAPATTVKSSPKSQEHLPSQSALLPNVPTSTFHVYGHHRNRDSHHKHSHSYTISMQPAAPPIQTRQANSPQLSPSSLGPVSTNHDSRASAPKAQKFGVVPGATGHRQSTLPTVAPNEVLSVQRQILPINNGRLWGGNQANANGSVGLAPLRIRAEHSPMGNRHSSVVSSRFASRRPDLAGQIPSGHHRHIPPPTILADGRVHYALSGSPPYYSHGNNRRRGVDRKEQPIAYEYGKVYGSSNPQTIPLEVEDMSEFKSTTSLILSVVKGGRGTSS